MPDDHDASTAGPGADPTQRREQGLRRVGAATKWTVAAAAAASAVLGMTYAQLLPGAPAPVPAALSAPATAPLSGPACVPTSTAAAVRPISSPTSASEENERDDDGTEWLDHDEGADQVERHATRATPAASICVGGTAASGLQAPAQPPAPAQRAPQTRTGAS